MPVTETFDVLVPSRVTVSTPDPVLTHTVTPIIVPPVNLPPIANAGPDQSLVIPSTATTINSVLNGSASTDPEGKPLTYGWIKLSGPAAGTVVTTNAAITPVTGLIVGTYIFQIRVVDSLQLFSTDNVTIVITKAAPPVNVPPIAKAGADQTIKLPINTINLDGSTSIDPDGNIASYKWDKISGPPCNLENPLTSVMTVKDMEEGIYIFRLNVTDNSGATVPDEVTITVLAADGGTVPAGTYPFTFVKNTAFKKRNFSGTEDWNGQFYVPFAGGFSDKYFRFVVCDFLKGASATLSFARFDQEIRKAIDKKAKFAFRIFVVNDSDNFLASETYDGATSRYPLAWHNKFQSESVKDFKTNGMWIPPWNSPTLLDGYENLLKEIANHINTTTYNGVAYKDVINYTDIGEYGQWGEFHAVNIVNNVSEYPPGTRPTVDSYKRYIDSHTRAFPNWPLVILFAAYDANWLGHTMTPPEVTYYALTAKNAWGYIGFRRDQWGATDNYIHDYLENNNRSFGSSGAFKNIIMERWKVAPVVGEPMGPGSNLSDIARQVSFYHACSVGNGNFTPSSGSSTAQFTAAEKAAGYYLSLISGKLVVSTDNDFDITISVENWGNTPCYENYNLIYELKNSAGQIVWTSTSPWKPALKLPGTHAIIDHFKISAQAKGTYSLSAVFKSDGDYRRMPLFNNNQQADSYIVLSNAVKF